MEVGQWERDLISVLSASLFYLCLTAVEWALLSLMEEYGSSDTADERAPALVRGKSFISVDLLGQVDWSWASRFTLFLYNPCPVPPLWLSLPFLFPRWVPTPFLQLQHTVRMMGLRFCSVKRVETSSLVLTPLSCLFGEGFQELGVEKLLSFSCSTAG